MNKLLLFLILVALSVLILMITRAIESQRQAPELGMVEGKLRPCRDKPNCVTSEYHDDDQHYIHPIELDDNITIDILKQAINDTGGEIVQQQKLYLRATYNSKLFRFIDDLELRIDHNGSRVHLRSASRVGTHDLGVNRKRINGLKKALGRKLNK